MSHHLIHLILTTHANRHGHWFPLWLSLHIGNGCGAIHSGMWSC